MMPVALLMTLVVLTVAYVAVEHGAAMYPGRERD